MKPLLLFIDDDPADSEIACWHLMQAGMDVDCSVVSTEFELAGAIAERMPEMILSDIVMPQWDCWGAFRAAHALAPLVPFALYSGAVSVQDRLMAEQAGVFGWAEKDRPGELIYLVRMALEQA